MKKIILVFLILFSSCGNEKENEVMEEKLMRERLMRAVFLNGVHVGSRLRKIDPKISVGEIELRANQLIVMETPEFAKLLGLLEK